MYSWEILYGSSENDDVKVKCLLLVMYGMHTAVGFTMRQTISDICVIVCSVCVVKITGLRELQIVCNTSKCVFLIIFIRFLAFLPVLAYISYECPSDILAYHTVQASPFYSMEQYLTAFTPGLECVHIPHQSLSLI